jgi:hypothetical protein
MFRNRCFAVRYFHQRLFNPSAWSTLPALPTVWVRQKGHGAAPS